MPGSVFQFDDFQLDCGRFELLRNGKSLRVERKPMELLILLCSSHGQLVTRAEIAGRLWSSEVFVDTEHGINTAIRKLRHLLHDDSEEPRFIQTVTGMGYRFIAPVAVVEPIPIDAATPANPAESVAADSIPAIKFPEPPRSHVRRWFAVATSAVLIIGILALTRGSHPLAARFLHRDTQAAITSLAVIPLDNLSGDPSQEYFADGMTDELTTMLAKNSTLRITSRTSVMQYKGARNPLPEIARALNVDAIVEGSVSRVNGHVHMTLQLIRADTDSHLWADSYDRDNSDFFALPDEAARAIASSLHSASRPHPAVRYVNAEAHDDFLRGHYLWVVGRNQEAGKFFQQAVQLQPDYAPGWAGLSEYETVGALNGFLDPSVALPEAEAAARKAVALDDSLSHAHNVLGAAIFFNEWQFTQALDEVKRAIELDPQNGEPYHLSAKILCAVGRNQEAIAIQKRGTGVNPIEHPGALAEIYLCARDFDGSIGDGLLRLQDFPAAIDVLEYLADAYHWKGMDKQATEMLARQFTAMRNPTLATAVRRAFDAGGYKAVVRCELADMQKSGRSQRVSTVGVARLHAMLGEHEQTMALLNQALREHDPMLVWIQTDPAYDFLHADVRYRSIVQRIGLPPAS